MGAFEPHLRPLNLAQVNLFVADFQRSLRFYRDQLGLEVFDLDPGPPSVPLVNWVSLIAGNMLVELFDARAAGREQNGAIERGGIELAFLVDDVLESRRRLDAAGVACGPVADYAWGRVAHFQDPDGNQMQVYEVFERHDAEA